MEAGEQSASCQWCFVDTVRELSDVSVMGREVVIASHPVGESHGAGRN